MKKIARTFLFIVSGFLILAQPAHSAGSPGYPSCVNPVGTVVAQYSSGVHGIPGDTGRYEGEDTVYRLNDLTYTQCFCDTYGKGIQTNWWRVPGITANEIASFEKDGWIFVANGNAWGLPDDPYLAKNSEYNCGGTGGGDPVGDVLSFAGTGNITFIYTLALFGIALIATGIVRQRKNTRNS